MNDLDKDLIERYLLDRLEEGEDALVVQKKKDPAFQQELDWQKQLLAVVKSDSQQKAKLDLQAFEKKIQASEAKPDLAPEIKMKSRNFRPIWLMAAAACGLLLIGFWATYNPSTSKRIYANNFTPYPNELVKVERSATGLSDQQQAFIDYQSGKYERALKTFDQWLEKEPRSPVAFYKAICLLQLEQPEKAIPLLKRMAVKPNHRFYAPAQWYLALTYIKMNDKSLAQPLLQKMANGPVGSYKRSAAREILNNL